MFDGSDVFFLCSAHRKLVLKLCIALLLNAFFSVLNVCVLLN